MPGNVGDALLELAAFGLMQAFGADAHVVDPTAGPPDVDEVVIAAGGNMGPAYPEAVRIRERVRTWGLPVTVLPQSFTGPEPYPYARVFVRERESLKLRPDAVLAPDLALGLDAPRTDAPPDLGEGVWLRTDAEAVFRGVPCRGDPARVCRTPAEYLRLAARHEHVITDRLHFAIAAMLGGRRATLLPNRYHKNRAMYECWLRELGCGWQDGPPPRPTDASASPATAAAVGHGRASPPTALSPAADARRGPSGPYDGVPPSWLRRPPVVVDVGAGVGAFPLFVKAAFDRDAVVHCFGPYTATPEAARRRLADVAGVTVYPFALGRGATSELGSSRSDTTAGGAAPGGDVKDAGVTWDELGLREVDVLKISAHGSEPETLGALGTRLLAVRVLLVEYHTPEARRRIDAALPAHTLFGVVVQGSGRGVVKYVRADVASG